MTRTDIEIMKDTAIGHKETLLGLRYPTGQHDTCESCCNNIIELSNELLSVMAERDTYKKLYEDYGWHLGMCAKEQDESHNELTKCTCGFSGPQPQGGEK